MKNKSLMKKVLIVLVVIFGLGVFVFMLPHNDIVVKNIKTKIFKKELTIEEHRKLVDEIIEKNSTKEANLVLNRDDENGVDYDDSFFGCEKRIKIKGGEDICTEGENQMRFDIEFSSTGDTQVERKEAIREIAYDALIKSVGTEGDPSAPYIDDLLGKNVCNVLITGNIEQVSHQGDIVNILFCDDNEEFTAILRLDSGGRDNEGNEHLRLLSHLPLAGSYIDDSFQYTLDELREMNKLPNIFPTISYEDAVKKVKNKLEGITIDNKEEIVALYDKPFYAAPHGIAYRMYITKKDGSKDIIWVHAFTGNLLTESERNDIHENF